MTFFSLLEVYVHAWARLLSEVDCASGVSINSPHAQKVKKQCKRVQLNNLGVRQHKSQRETVPGSTEKLRDQEFGLNGRTPRAPVTGWGFGLTGGGAGWGRRQRRSAGGGVLRELGGSGASVFVFYFFQRAASGKVVGKRARVHMSAPKHRTVKADGAGDCFTSQWTIGNCNFISCRDFEPRSINKIWNV